jgi:UDP-glucose 4-epimerase
MYTKETRILITGGAGFIGTNFTNDLLKRGHNPESIAIIDNLSHGTYLPKVHDKIKNFYREDICNKSVKKTIEDFKPDYIFHFAGLVSIYDCHANPWEAVNNNILGSINILDAAVAAGVNRVIFSETSAVYENCPMPVNGFNEIQSDPTTIYSTTKACLALLAESYHRTKGINYTALRYFNVAGPLQDYNRTIPPVFAGFIIRLMGGHNPIIFGDPLKARDYIDVDDVNSFHLLCMENNATANQTFNLGTGKTTTLIQLKDIIGNLMGVSNVNYDQYDAIAGEALNISADVTKAKSLGWAPTKSIEDTIKETIEYLQEEVKCGNVNPKTFMTNIELKKIKIN